MLDAQLLFKSFGSVNVSVFVKIEYQAIIKLWNLKGYTPAQITAEIDAVYGHSTPSYATVKFDYTVFPQI